jgi:hypothetical protein
LITYAIVWYQPAVMTSSRIWSWPEVLHQRLEQLVGDRARGVELVREPEDGGLGAGPDGVAGAPVHGRGDLLVAEAERLRERDGVHTPTSGCGRGGCSLLRP